VISVVLQAKLKQRLCIAFNF